MSHSARRGAVRVALRWLLAAGYLFAGVMHLKSPAPFVSITPHWVPMQPAVIAATGVAELFGAVGLAQPFSPRVRIVSGCALALYAVCVFPANINHMLIDMASPHPQLGWMYHVPRMVLQPILVWLALWTSGAIDWPFIRRSETN